MYRTEIWYKVNLGEKSLGPGPQDNGPRSLPSSLCLISSVDRVGGSKHLSKRFTESEVTLYRPRSGPSI